MSLKRLHFLFLSYNPAVHTFVFLYLLQTVILGNHCDALMERAACTHSNGNKPKEEAMKAMQLTNDWTDNVLLKRLNLDCVQSLYAN